MVEEKPEDEAKFNFGLDLLKRISLEFYALENSLVDENLTGAKNILESVNNELDAFLDETEKAEVKEIEGKITELINPTQDIDEVYFTTYQGRQRTWFKYPVVRTKLKPLLIQLNRKFRSLMKEKGLYMPPKSESGMF